MLKNMRRGAVKKEEARLVPVWFPEILIPQIDDAVKRLDTDRSKFIRNAVREKIRRDKDTATAEGAAK